MRNVARALGITERRVVDVIKDLEKAKLLEVEQSHRGNHYSLDRSACFRHPLLSPMRIDDFLQLWQASIIRETEAGAEDGASLEPAY